MSPDIGSLENHGFETQRATIQDSNSQERHLSYGDAERREAESRVPQEGGAQEEGAGDQQSEEPQGGEDILYTSASVPASDSTIPCLKTWSGAQDLPDPTHILSSPADASVMDSVTTDESLDPSVLQQRDPEVAGLLGSPDGQIPGGGCNGTLLGYTPLAEETTAGREETSWEERSPGNILASFTEAAVPEKQELLVETGESGHKAQEMGPGIKTKDPDSDGQLPGGTGMLPLQAHLTNQKAVELSSLDCPQDCEDLSLSPHTSSQLEHSCSASDLPQETKGRHSRLSIPIDLAGRQQTASSRDEAAWQESSAMELDFLPDSQIQGALDAPSVEAGPDQVRAFLSSADSHLLVGNKMGLMYLTPHLHNIGIWGWGLIAALGKVVFFKGRPIGYLCGPGLCVC